MANVVELSTNTFKLVIPYRDRRVSDRAGIHKEMKGPEIVAALKGDSKQHVVECPKSTG